MRSKQRKTIMRARFFIRQIKKEGMARFRAGKAQLSRESAGESRRKFVNASGTEPFLLPRTNQSRICLALQKIRHQTGESYRDTETVIKEAKRGLWQMPNPTAPSLSVKRLCNRIRT